ncbi:MAG: peptidoglycan glycosyltransferase [Ruminococcus sp.]|nr:peptidoglycan glycosyltransferase [Ruminococcus sp.]
MKTKGKKLTALLIAAAVFCPTLASCTSESDILHIIPTDKPAPDSVYGGITTAADMPEPSTETASDEMVAETTETTTTAPSVLRGNVYDCNKTLITRSIYDDVNGESRVYTDGYAIPFGNIVSRLSGGVDSYLDEALRIKNPVPVNADDNIGQSVQLTIDGDVQAALYDYMLRSGITGSIVVMRTDGSLLAETSYPSYDPQLFKQGANLSNNGNRAFQNAPPGSCFKIMSEVLADLNGIYSLYDEGTWEVDGATIVNWDHETGYYPIYERSLYDAFVSSSNIFFAKSFELIGFDKVCQDLDGIFHFLSPIYCDFGPIENSLEVYSDDDLRRSAFGQAYVRTCPIYLAALGREAVFGEMVKPFVVQTMVDTTDPSESVYPGSAPYEWLGSIPDSCRQGILDGMMGVGSNLGVYVPEGYNFYAKTGTAETGGDDILYITGVLQNYYQPEADYYVWSDYGGYYGSYIIVMQIQNPQNFGFNFASESGALYQGIINIVTGG